MDKALVEQHHEWTYQREGRQPATIRVADFEREGKRIVAFLEQQGHGPQRPVIDWPGVAEAYARQNGFALTDAYWYEAQPRRFANGRPHVSEYQPGRQEWRFETSIPLARSIIEQLGLDPDNLPLDI
ncbi:hypothetical protein [Azospirillum thermophilum]|uniref:Uncharacterized protein n=1 Tax=Azospirillum thermophilum TaxID=2202148 RepID=A0A2S2CMZ5_9PROT|nr:hypothetical protein [Azospirillum thermophilum]AWK85750.1 hypothetical protein DEW08_05835 [Azospirillum thermophilum]